MRMLLWQQNFSILALVIFLLKFLFERCFKIDVFPLRRRDSVLELQIVAFCAACVRSSIAFCNSLFADRNGVAASRFLVVTAACVIPASSNVCKIIAFSGIIAGGTFFCCQTIFAFFVISMCLPILKRRKTPTKRRKNPTKRRKKSRAQNVQTETAKKTGNDENLSSRR